MINPSLLSKHFIKTYNIKQSDLERASVEFVPARSLITSKRLDLVVKYKYVEYLDKKLTGNFIPNLYKQHIGYMTAGSFSEDGDDFKNTLDDYYRVFKELTENIKQNGFDPNKSIIPVGKDDVLLDGAHRVAVCAYYNLKIGIVRFPSINVANDIDFFIKSGASTEFIDYVMTEYCKINPDVHCAILWPRGYAINQSVDDYLNKNTKVIYKKTISMSKPALRNFIIQIYCNNDWIGGLSTHYSGATPQIDGCYDKCEKCCLYLVESSSLELLVEEKKEIRSFFGVGNYSLHSTDTQREAVQVVNLLLNNNSLNLLNEGNPDKYISVGKKIDVFKKELSLRGNSFDDFLIDGSAVMSLYGLRDSDDLDFLSFIRDEDINEFISCHNDFSNHYDIDRGDLIYCPNNFLFFNECKFISLFVLNDFKMKRNEKKDKEDVKLISLISNKKSLSYRFASIKSAFMYKKRNFTYYFPIRVIKVLKKIHLYNFARKVYHFFKKKRKNAK